MSTPDTAALSSGKYRMHAKSAAVSKSELPWEDTKTTNAAYEETGSRRFPFPRTGLSRRARRTPPGTRACARTRRREASPRARIGRTTRRRVSRSTRPRLSPCRGARRFSRCRRTSFADFRSTRRSCRSGRRRPGSRSPPRARRMGRGGPRRGRRARRLGNEPPGRSWTRPRVIFSAFAFRGRQISSVSQRDGRSTFVVLGRGHERHLLVRAARARGSRRTRVARTSRATPARGRAEMWRQKDARDAHSRRAPKRETFFSKELRLHATRVSSRSRDASLICRTGDRRTARCLSQSHPQSSSRSESSPAPVGAPASVAPPRKAVRSVARAPRASSVRLNCPALPRSSARRASLSASARASSSLWATPRRAARPVPPEAVVRRDRAVVRGQRHDAPVAGRGGARGRRRRRRRRRARDAFRDPFR